MPIALSSRSLGADEPLDEDIRLAAVSGFPWLVLDVAKMQVFLDAPEFDIRDLKRLFLRTQPAGLDGLVIESPDPIHLPMAEGLCKDARRVNAPVLVVRCDKPDKRLVEFAEVAQRWSTVLALVPPTGQLGTLTALLEELDHPALGLYIDIVEMHRGGDSLSEAEVARVVLVGVGDETADGIPTLPGHGIIPVAPLLAPLQAGGFAGLYVLDVPMDETRTDIEAWVKEGKTALIEVLTQIGWSEENA
jgi:sugar phosphate isomerase/epimerase